MTIVRIRRAVLSVWEKTGIVELARDLAARDVEILSTGGTLRALQDAGIPALSVSDFTGHAEIFDGRVKTLHPRLEGAILFRRGDHADEAARLQIPPVDLVVVNLYPFEAVTADPSCDLDRALEHVDIGGPTMIRAAAKNHPHVAVVVDPGQYGELRAELAENDGCTTMASRARWARDAFARVSAYDAGIASWLEDRGRHGAGASTPAPPAPRVAICASLVQSLRYGENPHQQAAFYGDPAYRGPTLAAARQHHGKELSYNNILDTDAAMQLVMEMESPSVVLVKHGNPCGAASAKDLLRAWDDALACDPLSAFGGILALNRRFPAALVERIGKQFLEVVLAPSYEPEALELLGKKRNLRVLELSGLEQPGPPEGRYFRRVVGGLLVGDWDRAGPEERRVVTKRAPGAEEREALEFAWRVAKHVKSNAIVLGRGTRTLGIGAGQMSRVDSSELACRKAARAGLDTRGSVLASDAFFPFRDGLDAAAAAGCSAVIQPGGSVRDEEVVAAADEHGIAMLFTGTRHFRH
jgi:phosphoribosylaminoimidazolecarboxamide formyltransferase/IMP cyclohydrolase